MAKKLIPQKIALLGKYIKGLREEQGLSIRQAAKMCKLSASYLSKLESGDTFKTVGIETMVKISEFYGISICAVLQETGFIETYEDDLPEFSKYLRTKYKLPLQAIRDMIMAKEIVEKKYKAGIK